MRQKMYEYIKFADAKKIKAMYTIIADDGNNLTPWQEDSKLLEKVVRTDADMESGKDEGIVWGKAKKQLLSRGKK
jgi:hypothetical protein